MSSNPIDADSPVADQRHPLPNTVAIIQARMASTRLPGKVLERIADRPMLQHIVDRARRATTLDHVLVATSLLSADDPIANYCLEHAIPCFRGSENDVLDRYYRAAVQMQADVIVRLTADCPLHDPVVIDRVVSAFYSRNYDYVSNIDPPSFPDGLDTEVFTLDALRRAWESASLPSDREHVTPYLRNSANGFHKANVPHAVDLSALRWTVDELADLAFVRAIFHAHAVSDFGFEDVIALLEYAPHLCDLNASYTRNEGYLRSLLADPKAA